VSTPSILLETDSFVAIHKPAGWVVNESNTAHGNPTVQDWIKENFKFELSQNDDLRNGIVHRIDKETSGVLLVAKTEESFYTLQKQFADRSTEKSYVALVHGEILNSGNIKGAIERNPLNRKRFHVSLSGREAETDYKSVSVYEKDKEKYTLVDLFPKTGRTHQLRVHLAHIKHPIVSDPLYGGRKTLRRDHDWCERLFLHAQSITVVDPDTKKAVTVNDPLPEDLTGALSQLRKLA